MLPSRSHCKLYPTDGYCDDENEQPFAPAFAFAPSFHFPSCQPNHTPLYILPSESGELVGEIRGEISESVWHLLSSRRRRSAERRKASEETTIDGGGSTRFELLDFPKRAMMTTLLPSIEEDLGLKKEDVHGNAAIGPQFRLWARVNEVSHAAPTNLHLVLRLSDPPYNLLLLALNRWIE
jgi:hypothetical protein